jgi:hypothetical protein
MRNASQLVVAPLARVGRSVNLASAKHAAIARSRPHGSLFGSIACKQSMETTPWNTRRHLCRWRPTCSREWPTCSREWPPCLFHQRRQSGFCCSAVPWSRARFSFLASDAGRGPCRLAWLRQTKRLESKVDGRPHRTVAFITGPVHVKTFQPASKQSTRARARQISSAEKEISAHHRSCPCGSTHDAGAPYANKTHRRPTGDEHAPDASSRSSAAHRRGERRTPAPCRSVVAVQARRLPVACFPRRAQSRRR